MAHRMRSTRWCALAVAVVALAPANAAAVVTPVAFDAFTRLTDAQVDSVQCRVTFVGSRTGRPPGIAVFTVGDTRVAWNAFEQIEVRTVGRGYLHDHAHMATRFVVSRSVMRAAIDSMESVAEYTRKGDDGWVSVAFVGTADGDSIGFDGILDTEQVVDVGLRALGHAVEGVDGAICALVEIERSPEMIETFGPMNITDSVTVTVLGLGEDATDSIAVGRFVVTSHAVTVMEGPVRVVYSPPFGVTMLNASGTTCVTIPAGLPYIDVAAGDLGPGESVEKTVRFSNPYGRPIPGDWSSVLGGVGVP